MKNYNLKILNTIASIGIALTFVLLICLPFILGAFNKITFIYVDSKFIFIITLGIYICAIPYVVALLNLKRLCFYITSNNPFSRSIPKLINNIAYCAFSEVILFNLMNMIFYFLFNLYFYGLTILFCVVVSFLSLAIGVFAFISSKLFENIIDIKYENDMTI